MLEHPLPAVVAETLRVRQDEFLATGNHAHQLQEEHLRTVGAFLSDCFRGANPGLTLDRMVGYPTHTTRSDGRRGTPVPSPFTLYDEPNKKVHLQAICEAMRCNAAHLNPVLTEGWATLLSACDGAEEFRLRTVWRLAMHLSRATAVENASLCLHPVYGFPYLPGTGLKGLASTWAKLHGPGDNSAEFKRIFGTQGGTGSVLFLEAWPASISDDVNRPTIEVDIVNNHHPEYYQKRGVGAPPGDWESPIPVYFLAVAPNVTFRFAVAKARPSTVAADVTLARDWLKAGLTELGFGAKTAAGYGYFTEISGEATSGAQAADSDPLEQFKQAHKALASDQPTKSAAGQAVTDAEKMEDPQVRRCVAEWVHDRLTAWNMLDARTKKNPTSYGERLRTLFEETD